jgi:putative phage-type endonuclease
VILQRTPEWYAARLLGITSTDIAAILGVSPWKSEGDVAREKLGAEREEPDDRTARRWRLGLALEDAIADEEYHQHGYRLRRVRRLITSPTIPWALTSLDFERVGEKTIVEAKTSTSKEWDDGLPESVEAQVRWQMGVAGYPRAHVAALRFGRSLVCYDVVHDQAVFDGLVTIAEDFRRRLAAGGPFDETRSSLRRAWPTDDGSVLYADPDSDRLVRELLATRAVLAPYREQESRLEASIIEHLKTASVLVGDGWQVTYKAAKDTEVTDWKALAHDLLGPLSSIAMRDEYISRYTTTKTGSRRLLVRAKETRDDGTF